MAIAIVDYGMGNLHSVSKAVERLGYEPLVTGKREEILVADGIILPGVGAFGDAMEQLRETSLDSVMKDLCGIRKPALGICLGMRLLFSRVRSMASLKGWIFCPDRLYGLRVVTTRCRIWAGILCSSRSGSIRCLQDLRKVMCILSIRIMFFLRFRLICWR